MTEDLHWQAAWTQAMTDFRDDDEEPPFADVTIRLTVPVGIGGRLLRAELSNRFGDDPVRIGHAAVIVRSRSREITFAGQPMADIAPGQSRWTDPLAVAITRGDEVSVDMYLPEPTPYATANGFRFQRSTSPGDRVGATPFPAPAAGAGTGLATEGTDWSLPSGGPFLRAMEVAGAPASAVIVCLGASITTLGWPQLTNARLGAAAQIAVLNRGIPGNRLRHHAPAGQRSWGRSGLSRFQADVLETSGVTHVVLSHAANDIGLPGTQAPLSELPSIEQQIAAYRQLIDCAHRAGLGVILATITPMAPEHADAPAREHIRRAVNDWMRTSDLPVADFDRAIRADATPARIADEYDVGDHQHPNITGQNRLAETMAHTILRLQS